MPECPTCKNYVTVDYLRVFGDNDGRIDTCPNCRGVDRRERTRQTTTTSERTVYLRDVIEESTDVSEETSESETDPQSSEKTGLRARIGAVSGLLER